jgi:hypothetical protein
MLWLRPAKVALLEPLAAHAHNDETYPANQCNRAEHRRDGNGFRLLVADLERTGVNIFLFVREGDAAQGKAYNADDDKN